ncbi:sensor histidine kinase, partial [Clostridium sp. Sa3CUN1]|nr:sensor histidine kinase [Clostridium gallinarum]
MDTKLTKNKILKDLEKYTIIVLAIFFSISLFRTLEEYKNFNLYFGNGFYNNNLVKSQFFILDSNLNNYSKIFLDLYGNRKESVYEQKVEEKNLEKEKSLQEAEENIRQKAKDMNLSEEEILEKIEEAKKIIMVEDNSVDEYFNYYLEEINNILYKNVNIEFFLKDKDGAKITNIEDGDIEKKIEENSFLNDENYYYMYFPGYKVTDDKNLYSKELESIYNYINYDSGNLIKFYRIPKELRQGDILYDEFLRKSDTMESLNRKVAVTSLLGILILVVSFIIYKNRKNNYTNYLEDILIKIPIDIRFLIFIYSFNILKSLIFNVIPYYENSSYSNGVILKSVIFIILDYYFFKDIVLILNKKRNKSQLLIVT